MGYRPRGAQGIRRAAMGSSWLALIRLFSCLFAMKCGTAEPVNKPCSRQIVTGPIDFTRQLRGLRSPKSGRCIFDSTSSVGAKRRTRTAPAFTVWLGLVRPSPSGSSPNSGILTGSCTGKDSTCQNQGHTGWPQAVNAAVVRSSPCRLCSPRDLDGQCSMVSQYLVSKHDPR
jgi:hypothetical protein